jgi:plasmid stabilization system protein ParE
LIRIKWLDLAVDDLDDIAGYIAEDNPDAARRVVSRL